MTGFEWRDAKGRPCRLIVEVYNGESAGHVATEADLLSALGQLSPESDGPTDNELDSIWWDHTHAACDSRAGNRALYNAGLALGEQKLAHEKQCRADEELSRKSAVLRAERLESELAATKALVESAQADRQRAVDDLFAEAKRSGELQAELASTEAKLAEVMKRHPSCAAVRAERDAFRADLEQMRDLLPNDWQTQTKLGGQVMVELKKQRDEAARLDEKLAEVERERDLRGAQLLMVASELCGDPKLDPADKSDPRHTPALSEARRLRSELASARRVVEAAHRLKRATDDTKLPWREATTQFGKALIGVIDGLASAGTDADRTEAPRAEAGESGPDLDRVAERLLLMRRLYPNYNVYTRGPYGLLLDALEEIRPDIAAELRSGEAPGDIYGRHFDDETGEPKPTAEPKPEPQSGEDDEELPRQELGLCSGCDCPKARCDAIRPPVIKCCPDCKHEGTGQP